MCCQFFSHIRELWEVCRSYHPYYSSSSSSIIVLTLIYKWQLIEWRHFLADVISMAECYFCFLRNISDECFDRGKHKEERAAERENKLVLQEIDKQREQQETSILYECAESFSQEQKRSEDEDGGAQISAKEALLELHL